MRTTQEIEERYHEYDTMSNDPEDIMGSYICRQVLEGDWSEATLKENIKEYTADIGGPMHSLAVEGVKTCAWLLEEDPDQYL